MGQEILKGDISIAKDKDIHRRFLHTNRAVAVSVPAAVFLAFPKLMRNAPNSSFVIRVIRH
jgi:hypothetical protein